MKTKINVNSPVSPKDRKYGIIENSFQMMPIIFQVVIAFLLGIVISQMSIAQEKSDKKDQDTAVIDFGGTRILICKNICDTASSGKENEDDDEIDETQFFLMDLGINGYLYNRKLTMPDEYKNMNVDLARSRYFDIQFITQGINIYNQQLYLLLGIGMSFNNYVFDENIVLVKNDTAL